MGRSSRREDENYDNVFPITSPSPTTPTSPTDDHAPVNNNNSPVKEAYDPGVFN